MGSICLETSKSISLLIEGVNPIGKIATLFQSTGIWDPGGRRYTPS